MHPGPGKVVRPGKDYVVGVAVDDWEEVAGPRKYVHHRRLSTNDYDTRPSDLEVTTIDKANLISSVTDSMGQVHMPVIDLDVPCYLLPSSTPGHCHLYINKELTKTEYADLLVGFGRAGLVQQGVLKNQWNKLGATYLRLPWVKKGKD